MAKNLLIVESPAKVKTINKVLGKDFQVMASYGHVRDLPSKDGSVDTEHDFAMAYEVIDRNEKHVDAIAKAAKAADAIYLATDLDREGEAISWHVYEILKKKNLIGDRAIHRVTFAEITPKAIKEAIAHPRELSLDLINAQQARRALDYLVGFNLSPLLWKKVQRGLSAGRVQSPALRMIVEREEEIERFVAREYWSIDADCFAGQAFGAKLTMLGGKRLDQFDLNDEAKATAARDRVLTGARAHKPQGKGALKVADVQRKDRQRRAAPPFITSTLQQEAARKLGFGTQRTMRVAQGLYEGVDVGEGGQIGLITYMRTDSVSLSNDALAELRQVIAREFGSDKLPDAPQYYKSKSKNAQEAHEAIRPTDMFRSPDQLHVDADQKKLYGLIYRRTLACQMRAAEIERTTADIAVHAPGRDIVMRAVGSVVTFPGFLAVYGVEAKSDRDDAEDDEDSRELPPLAVGDTPKLDEALIEQHFTQPPPRYSEASLIKKMEELGIGRPSTYAATISVLQDRNYVRLEKRALIPEDRGRIVTAFLENFFAKLVEYGFTAGLEEKLDEISAGALPYKDVLRDFWTEFTKQTDEIKDLRVSEVLDALNESLAHHIFPAKADGSDPRLCPTCGSGQLSLKLGKFGAFIGCSNYPECRHTMQLSDAATGATTAAPGDGILGVDDKTGLNVLLKSGRFGPYVQLGDGDEPKRSSLPKGWSPDSLTLEKALQLLALPRAVGLHPETGNPISAGIGRYGPFILHDGKYANLPDAEEVFTVGINRAVDLLAAKAAGGGRGRSTPAAIKSFDDAPGGAITVREGRYGPYVNQGKINATIPKTNRPEELTLDEAAALIAARAESTGAKAPRKAAAKPAAKAKPAAAKKPAAKAAAAKKPAAPVAATKKPARKPAASKKPVIA